MKRILYIFICTAVWLMCIPGANAQVNDEALTRSGAVGTYNGTRSDFLTMSGKLSRYPKLSKAGESLKYAPIVSTDSVPEATVTSYSATVFGNILFNGWEDEVLAQGFELSTNPDFEGDDVQTVQVTPENTYVECDQPCPANVYSYNFENLIGGSTYYVRAYATNAVGTSYGETLTFVIENTNACPGTPTVTDHEGNIYTTVQLGYQCWMRQNMRCTHFPDGEEIPYGGYSNSSPYSSLQPYYYNPNGANPMTVERGYLYNWPATLDTTFTENTAGSYEKRRGICPKGWHVPTIAEWRILLDYLKENQYSCDDYESHIAKAMASTTGWYNNSTACTPGNEPNTNNLSGFTAVPANYFYSSGNQINDNGYYARFWSSTTYKQYNSDVVGQACYVGIEYSNDEVYDYNSMYKQGGFSVRCLRDTTGLKVPTLEILGVSGVTTDTARVKSNVVADGGAPVTERGICWSVDTLPTIDSYRWVDTTGTGLGDFTSIIRNLTPSHKYHVRAYAINFEGVGYSADSTFTAPAPANACQGTPTVTDRDGNVYNTVQIGYQCWTRENMRCTTLPDGRKIGYGGNNNNNRRCYDTLKLYYSDTITATPLEQRGYLYNWYAAMDTVSSTGNLPYMSFEKRQGICPDGWHVPSAAEWDTLNNYSKRQSEFWCEYYGSYYIAKALASKYWWQPYQTYSVDSCYVGVKPEQNNVSGMSIVPSGYYYNGGNRFENTKTTAYFWSSSLYSDNSTYYKSYNLSNSTDYVMGYSSSPRSEAIPVRCLRDTTGLYVPTVTGSINEVGTNEASFNGEVTKDGGETVTNRGFCYSMNNQMPTINDNYVAVGDGLGEFSELIGYLVPGKTYYVRAYATNYEGTGYSDVMTITTGIPDNVCPNVPTVTDHEGNVYNTVQIGNQCWTRENMRCKTTPKNPNVSVSTANSYGPTSSYAPYIYTLGRTDSVWINYYGYSYNWPAAMDTAATEVVKMSFVNRRGICPEGWHIPSSAEWDSLFAYVRTQDEFLCNNSTSYIVPSLADKYSWEHYNSTCVPSYNSSENNATGFTSVAAGYFNNSYSSQVGRYVYYWTSTTYSTNNISDPYNYAYYNQMSFTNSSIDRDYSSKSWGYSVRCVMNQEGAVEMSNATVITTGVSEVTTSSATFHGEVTFGGNSPVTERGFCWSHSENPTVENDHNNFGTGVGEFEGTVNVFLPGYTYHVRAYAINALGVSYGEDMTFTTSRNFHVNTLPYETDFTDGEAWFNTGSNDYGYWMTGTTSGYCDGSALYVTQDGETAGYGGNYSYDISAEKFLKMPEGDSIHVEFDVLAGGDDYSNFLKVFIAPTTWNFAYNSTYYDYNYSTNALNFRKYLCMTDYSSYYYKLSMTQGNTIHVSVNMRNPSPNDTAKIAFLWRKSSYNGSQPGAVISNLRVSTISAITDSITEVTTSSAKVYGEVRSWGDVETVTERGICWSLRTTPTVTDNHIVCGSGIGSFNADLSNLTPNTRYNVRTYAKTSAGHIVYSDNKPFATELVELKADTLPYYTHFADAQNWFRNDGSAENIWTVAVPGGSNDTMLYVTNDNMLAGEPGYNNNVSSIVTAEKLLVMPNASESPIVVSFDVKVGGESTYDYLKVFLAPKSFEANSAYSSSSSDYAVNFSDYLSLTEYTSEPYKLNLTYGNTLHVTAQMENPAPGDTAKLIFLWRNDGSVGKQPAAVISNLEVKEMVSVVCEPITDFPWTEGFENSGNNMPDCWSQQYGYGTENWVFNINSHGSIGSAHSGNNHAYIFEDANSSHTTMLISPVFDFSNVENPYLSFWHTQQSWGSDQDELRVYYRTSSTAEWQLLAEYTSNIDHWTLDSFALPNPSSTYQIAFEGTLRYGYGINLDDVTVGDAGGNAVSCPQSFTDYRDHENYVVMLVGNNCWMAQNLRYRDESLPLASDQYSISLPYIYAPNGDISANNILIEGYLYNWTAAINNASSTSEGMQGLCPEGWHLPTEAEAIELVGKLDSDEDFSAQFLKASGYYLSSSSNNPRGFGSCDWYWVTYNEGQHNACIPWCTDNSSTNAISTNSNMANALSIRCVREADQEEANCNPINTFPFTEGFESNSNLPNCWSQEYVIGDSNWSIKAGHNNQGSIHSSHGGSSNAYFYSQTKRMTTKLVSPVFDFSDVENPYVSFWHTQANWGNDQDTLTVYYRTSETAEWQSLVQYTSSITTWTFDSLMLPNPSSFYQIAFEGLANYGFGITLDDITVGNAIVCPSLGASNTTFISNGQQILNVSIADYDADKIRENLSGYAVFGGNPSSNFLVVYKYKQEYSNLIHINQTGDNTGELILTIDFALIADSAESRGVELHTGDQIRVMPLLYLNNCADNYAYGTQVAFNMPTMSCLKLVDTRNNKTYQTMMVDDACWMKENLRYQGNPLFTNGDYNNVITTSEESAYIYYPGGQAGAFPTYGYLYNWAAATNNASVTSQSMQGVCPDGWHLPTYAEANALKNKLNQDATFRAAFLINHAGIVRPSGSSGAYEGFGQYDWFWVAQSGNETNASLDISQSTMLVGGSGKAFGRSIRCVKN